MGDFAELIIFLAVVMISLLAGGKKRKRPQGPAQRARPRPVRPPQDLSPTPRGTAGTPTRDSLAREILQLLGAEVQEEIKPSEPAPPSPREPVALDDFRREAVTLERSPERARALDSVDLSREKEHEEFHDLYVDATAVQRPRSKSRYHRVTPRTAREAVIWKTIFSPPKALE